MRDNPAVTLLEQHHRAGPSLHQEAHHGEFGLPVGGRSMADDRGIRGNAHDPEGADSAVGQRGCGRATAIHSQPLRDCRLTPRENFETAASIAALLFATDPSRSSIRACLRSSRTCCSDSNPSTCPLRAEASFTCQMNQIHWRQ